MNTEKMKQVKLLSILIAALAIVSCRPSSNQPTSESSASDSVELKKQEAWESAHRLDSMGNHREALLLRERTLSEYCPNSAECLQYKGLRCYIENKQDSANFYFDKAMRMCDMALHDSLDINMVTIRLLSLPLQMVTDLPSISLTVFPPVIMIAKHSCNSKRAPKI